MTDQLMLFRLDQTGVEEIPPEEDFPLGEAKDLPGTLVIKPDTYRVFGHNWELREPGLYRFIHIGDANQQRIVYKPKNKKKPDEEDILPLLSGLSWIASHGSRDEDQASGPCTRVAEGLRVALTKKLIVTCRCIADLGNEVCERQGIRARRVSGLTLHRQNGYNDTHQLLEVDFNGHWTLVDLDAKCLFLAGGRRLSLLDFWRTSQGEGEDYELKPLAAATRVAVGHFHQDGYDHGLWLETVLGNDRLMRNWYQRVMMIPVIWESGECYFTATSDSDRDYVLTHYPKWGLLYLTPDEFNDRFYKQRPPWRPTE